MQKVRFPDWPICEPVEVFRSCLEEWKKQMSRDTTQEENEQKNARRTLGLNIGDDGSDLRRAYRSLARKYHPGMLFTNGSFLLFLFLKICLKIDKNPAGRDMFEKIQVAYELLLPVVEGGGKIEGDEEDGQADDDDADDDAAKGIGGGKVGMAAIKILLKTQIIICKRHKDEIGAYKYPAYEMLLECLSTTNKFDKGENMCFGRPTRANFIKTAVELTYQTCLVSPLNAEELVEQGGVVILAQVLRYFMKCFVEAKEIGFFDRPNILTKELCQQIIMHVIRTISGVAHFDAGRVAITRLKDMDSFCMDWRRCVDGRYWDDSYPLIKKYSLEGVAKMSKDTILQNALVGSGITWPLIRCLLSFDPTLENVSVQNDDQIDSAMTQAASNNHAKLAAVALGTLCGVMIEESLVTPFNSELSSMIKTILTPPISKMLRNKRSTELLKTLNVNIETPTRIWNVNMRKELIDFVATQEKSREEVGYRSFEEEIVVANDFSYTDLRNEINIGGIYLRVFNSLGGGKVCLREIENTSAFAIALLQFISKCIASSNDENSKHNVTGQEFFMSVKALLCLVQIDGLIDDVLYDRSNCGPAILLNLLDLDETSEAFELASDILTLLSPKQSFADAVAEQKELWRLLQVLERTDSVDDIKTEKIEDFIQNAEDGRREADLALAIDKRQRRGWALLESLTSSPSIADYLVKSSGWLELLGMLAGYKKFTTLWSSRQGAAKTLARSLWDPTTGVRATSLLSKFLPLALVSLLKEEGADALLSAFDGSCETPELIWDGEMRVELRSAMADHLDKCLDARENDNAREEFFTLPPGFQVKYKKLQDELYIGGVYVRLFLKEPSFALHDPSGFLEMLLQRWSQELNTLTGAQSEHQVIQESSELSVAKQDVLQLLTSAAVYLCKIKHTLCDKLSQWGYMSQAALYMQRSLDVELSGTPLLSAVRIVHVASTRRSNVEALASLSGSNGKNGIISLLIGAICGGVSLHIDSAFMIECLLKIFKDALGDVDQVNEIAYIKGNDIPSNAECTTTETQNSAEGHETKSNDVTSFVLGQENPATGISDRVLHPAPAYHRLHPQQGNVILANEQIDNLKGSEYSQEGDTSFTQSPNLTSSFVNNDPSKSGKLTQGSMPMRDNKLQQNHSSYDPIHVNIVNGNPLNTSAPHPLFDATQQIRSHSSTVSDHQQRSISYSSQQHPLSNGVPSLHPLSHISATNQNSLPNPSMQSEHSLSGSLSQQHNPLSSNLSKQHHPLSQQPNPLSSNLSKQHHPLATTQSHPLSSHMSDRKQDSLQRNIGQSMQPQLERYPTYNQNNSIFERPDTSLSTSHTYPLVEEQQKFPSIMQYSDHQTTNVQFSSEMRNPLSQHNPTYSDDSYGQSSSAQMMPKPGTLASGSKNESTVEEAKMPNQLYASVQDMGVSTQIQYVPGQSFTQHIDSRSLPSHSYEQTQTLSQPTPNPNLSGYMPNPVEGKGIDVRTTENPQEIASRNPEVVRGAPGCAHGRHVLLVEALNCELPRVLLEKVLDSPTLTKVKNPDAATVYAVDLLKLLCKDPGFGMKFGIILDALPGWKKYKSQNHSLYITGRAQKIDYFLTDGGKSDMKMLTSRSGNE